MSISQTQNITYKQNVTTYFPQSEIPGKVQLTELMEYVVVYDVVVEVLVVVIQYSKNLPSRPEPSFGLPSTARSSEEDTREVSPDLDGAMLESAWCTILLLLLPVQVPTGPALVVMKQIDAVLTVEVVELVLT